MEQKVAKHKFQNNLPQFAAPAKGIFVVRNITGKNSQYPDLGFRITCTKYRIFPSARQNSG